jgi:allophanate hydrolase subunit 2
MSTLPTVFERMRFTKFTSAVLALAGVGALAQPLPTGMQVTQGQATAVTTGTSLNITATDKSVLQWQQFSIGAGHAVNFQLPSAGSRVLNQ